MITKGIIKSIDLLGNTCTVHIPFFETAGNDPIIETATVSNTPGSYNGYKVGDVVYVAFEDGSMSTPVVIGKLYLGTEKEKADPRGVSNVEESTAAKKATLPADAKLAAKIDSNVPNTTVPYSSLFSIANGLNTLNTNVGQMDRDYGNRFKQVISDIEGNKSTIEQTSKNVLAKVSGYKLDDKGNPIPTEPTEFGWNLQNDSWCVFNHDKTILTADENGLHVSGRVDAGSGHIGNFMIGDIGISSSTGEGDSETAWIPKYAATPTTDTGVYVGTDGIKLGKNFSVDPGGKLSTKSLEIIDGNDKVVFNADANTGAVKMSGFTVTDNELFAGENSTFIGIRFGNPAPPEYITFTGSQIISFRYDADFFINYFTDTVEIKAQLAESATDHNQIIFGHWNEVDNCVAALYAYYPNNENIMWYYSTSDGNITKIDTGVSLTDTQAHIYKIVQGKLYVDGQPKGTTETAEMAEGLKECPLAIGGGYCVDSSGDKGYISFLYGNVYNVKLVMPGSIWDETNTDTFEYSPDVRNGDYGLRLINSVVTDDEYSYNFETPINNTVLLGSQVNREAIYLGSEDPKTAPFSVTNAGELIATIGKIGGWTLNKNALIFRSLEQTDPSIPSEYNIRALLAATDDGIEAKINGTKANWTLTVGSYFGVTPDGQLNLNAAQIGSWMLTPEGLSSKRVQITETDLQVWTTDATTSVTLGAEGEDGNYLSYLKSDTNNFTIASANNNGFNLTGVGGTSTEIPVNITLALLSEMNTTTLTAKITPQNANSVSDDTKLLSNLPILGICVGVTLVTGGTRTQTVPITFPAGTPIKGGTIPIALNGRYNYVWQGNANSPPKQDQQFASLTIAKTIRIESSAQGINYSLANLVPDGTYNLGDEGHHWNDIYIDNINGTAAPSTASDRKLKNTIEYDISKYDAVFDNLKPVSYKYNNSTSDRTHLGFIAQDVQEAIQQAGLTDKDYAIVTIDGAGFDAKQGTVIDEETATYYIRYPQLHALEIRQIQLLKQEVKELKATLVELKSKIT